MALIASPYRANLPSFVPHPTAELVFRLLRDGAETPAVKTLYLYRDINGVLEAVFQTDAGSAGLTRPVRIGLATLLAQPEWLAIGSDDTFPRSARGAYISLTESGTYTFNITRPFDLYTLGGSGYLAGSFPGGITTVDGVPTAATVRVLYRPAAGQPGDGALVAEVQSAADGSWRVDGLDPALKFDVVGRKAWFNDVIMSNVSPKVD